ncbi:MAG: restriction endonuclease [Chloroflexota bacterium]
MALWMVRAGKHGEREDFALDNSVIAIGWEEIQQDLSVFKARQEIDDIVQQVYVGANPNTLSSWVGQLWAFLNRIQGGDLVALPLKSRAAVAIGKVTGGYAYRPDNPPDARHVRPVEWIRKDVPRSAFDQDILYSLGSLLTVCQIQRNNAEDRVRAILRGKPATKTGDDGTDEATSQLNLEEYARDQVMKLIGRRFRGHELSRLVNAVLRAQGYQTRLSPAGPDGGVDIIAGAGPMGFDEPRLVVQVKSSDQPLDVRPLRELKGIMSEFKAEQGLLVAWGGFNRAALAEASKQFFAVRLWDAGDLVDELLENYEHLPADIQAELPLKRVWALVPEE